MGVERARDSFPTRCAASVKMPDELEERLQKHARSFDGLLSLIPAKLYYGEDVSDQWKRKKQTPEQKREAKKQKLDPDNWKSAKDVMDERASAAKKRKRGDDDEQSESEIVDLEKPKAEQEDAQHKTKKRKADSANVQPPQAESEEERIRRRKEAKAAKKERKKEKKLKAKEKVERQKARKLAEQGKSDSDPPKQQTKPKKSNSQVQNKPGHDSDEDDTDNDVAEEISIDGQPLNALTMELEDEEPGSDASNDEPADVFSPPQESAVSSTSSIQPVTDDGVPPKAPVAGATSNPDLPPPKDRPAAAIASFRSQRKADSDSVPKSRAELLEQRRRQEERRRAEKKEQKRREKEEAQRKQEEEIAARFSPGGSGSLRSPVSTPDAESNNFSFGRIAFDDGSNFDPNGEGASESKKRKGPSDPSTALQAALKKKSRLSGLDADKQERIASQDMWMNARKRASGEKVKDDTSLLKKALKRHEGQKKKSEKEWTERDEGIKKSIEVRQKKRTENLAKRKDEKGKGKGKKVKRPGFEGSFKGRTGGKGKA